MQNYQKVSTAMGYFLKIILKICGRIIHIAVLGKINPLGQKFFAENEYGH